MKHGDIIDYTASTQRVGSRHITTGRKISRCPKCGKKGYAARFMNGGKPTGTVQYTHKMEYQNIVMPSFRILDTCTIKQGITTPSAVVEAAQ